METTQRSKEEINNEYTRCATLLGDKQFKVKFLSVESELLMEKMNQLNKELADQMGPPPTENK